MGGKLSLGLMGGRLSLGLMGGFLGLSGEGILGLETILGLRTSL